MRIVPEAERLDARAPLALLIISIAIIGLSLLATVVVRRSVGGSSTPAGGLSLTSPAGVPVQQVGTEPVQAAGLFEAHGTALSTRALPRELQAYGWVDRERGLIRIPIARAKQLYLKQTSAARAQLARPRPEQPELERRDGSQPLTAPAAHPESQ